MELSVRLPIGRTAALSLAVVAVLLGGTGRHDVVARQTPPASPTGKATVGATRAYPVPLGEETTAGDATLHVLEVVTGQAAADAVVAADPSNGPPRDGVAYVLVRLSIANEGDRPLLLSNDDFALVGGTGLVRRFLWVVPPEPALPAEIGPGEVGEGWVVLSAEEGDRGVQLLYDNLSLGGIWADRYFALDGAAPASPVAGAAAGETAAGRDPATPAGIGETVVAGTWRLELVEVVSGAAVFDLVDYRTGALRVEDATGASDGSVWLALRFRIANVGGTGGAATFPANAFALVDAEGVPYPDLATLTPPQPDAAGDYFPGAEREGWVAFDVPTELGPVVIRFLPYAETSPTAEPRFFSPGL